MRTIKRLLTMVAVLLCSVVANAHDFEVDGIFYNITSETTVEVTYSGTKPSAFDGRYSGNVAIPQTVSYNEKSYSVTGIGANAFYYCDLTSIEIPNSVTVIGDCAFQFCVGLKGVKFPNNIKTIGKSVFSGCFNLAGDIVIPKSATSIGHSVFAACDAIKSITVESGNAVYDSRDNCNAIIETASNKLIAGYKNTIIPNSVTAIGDYAFYGCFFTTFEIPNSITSIGECAFQVCTNLKSITIPASVKSIGPLAFEAGSLENITVESGNTVYDSRDNCNALIETASNKLISGSKNAIIPNSVTSIEKNAFGGCSITSITIPNSVTSIGEYAFSASSLTSVTVPASVKSMGVAIFYDCSNLESVTFCDGVTNIGIETFSFCGALKSVELPASLKSVNQGAFYKCTGLTNITIPEGVTSIENWAFFGCTALANIDIPASVTNFGTDIFGMCTSLKSITLPAGIATIPEYTFYGCTGLESLYLKNPVPAAVDSCNFAESHYANTTIYVPQGSLAAYKAADEWKKFANIQEFDVTGIEDVAVSNAAIKVTSNGISLSDAEGEAVAVYSANGTLIEKTDAYAGEEIILNKGVYIVRIGNKTIKVKI